MIIFDLDGTLANCEHRRNFVDPEKDIQLIKGNDGKYFDVLTGKKWHANWKAFYEACDKDEPIQPVVNIWNSFEVEIACNWANLAIWSGRCESVREKTLDWLENNLYGSKKYFNSILKMRPIGNNTPDDQLKERWLDEEIADGKTIDFCFDDRPKVIRMYRRREIFVFDCNQDGKEF